MKISARNIFEGKVQSVTKGAVNAEVTLVLAGGEHIVSIITNSGIDSLGLETGKTAYAIVKANEVIVGKGVDGRCSAPNGESGCKNRTSQRPEQSQALTNLCGKSVPPTRLWQLSTAI
jgi:molybdate transport system regulatory protein